MLFSLRILQLLAAQICRSILRLVEGEDQEEKNQVVFYSFSTQFCSLEVEAINVAHSLGMKRLSSKDLEQILMG